MFQSLSSLLQPQLILTLLVAVVAFAAVIGVAAPLIQPDPLKERMKAVGEERERLRVERKRGASGEVRLREREQSGVIRQIVEILNLRKVFEAETSRALLRQAGLRSERHLTLYLAIRVVSPIGMAIASFLYANVILPDAPALTRIGVASIGFVFGNYLPYLLLRNRITRRQQSIRRAWPDALDLMLICVEAGMAIEPDMQRVAKEIGVMSVPLAEELALTVAELAYLQDRRKAFENLGKRIGLPQVKSVVTSLIQSERYGTPLGTALRVLAQENRDMRVSEAERRAAALPPRLTVPMMVFFMPVIFVVILGPVAMTVSKMFN